MRLFCTLFALGLGLMPLSASDVEQNRAEEIGKKYKIFGALNGQVYRGVTVSKITDAGITLMHADGSARLGFDDLSPKQRKTFGITREEAEAIYAKEMKAQAAYEAQVAAKQKERQVAQQKAQVKLLAQQAAARLEAERLEAERLKTQLAQGVQEPADATSIVSVLEVPRFPLIRGTDNEILYPIQASSRPQRNTYYRSSGTTYPVRYGGTYYSPVRYGGYGGNYCYPSYGGSYRPSYHSGSWGWINYKGSKFNIGIKW